ncbi:bifunctional diaminohydroxyphosphoribosylaminopyrimidine deaminase/5-amino-6-(5-phosphoribosylamino)uracil reductase RibD [Desulfocapsa sulfexigens]|nr:bifunctional diaminohydroxyphosphoribosylaminopyrimidine deaminase/5-amino-6-(5-phosphoribosylamino)uracil reductase RibD [Desulfocapsa sulfexigens]
MLSLKKKAERTFSKRDEQFMRLALHQARKGIGRTSPNPCVGAVVVQDDDTVVSRGYHKKAGTPHAEVHALRKAGSRAEGATIYVTLEPCNHTGRTPPCSHAVAAAGIKRVVVGMVDPNPLVSGSGISYLRKQGIEVLSGVLENECKEVNLPFVKHITTGKPFVVMKAGMSLDGKLSYQKGVPGKMTGAKSRRTVHGLRNSMDAILVGVGTVIADNPSLTTRLVKCGRDPLRVVLDSSLRISSQAKILHLDSSASTLIFCSPVADRDKKELLGKMDGVNVQSVALDETGRGLDMNRVLDHLGKMGICSLLVEGGAEIHGSFLSKSLVDRVMLFVAPLFGGSSGTPLLSGFPVSDNTSAPRLQNIHYKKCGEDVLVRGDFFTTL